MPVGICDTPEQSALVAVGAGLAGGAAALLGGLGLPGAVAVSATLALAGELLGHAVRRDEQFVTAVERVRRWLGRSG